MEQEELSQKADNSKRKKGKKLSKILTVILSVLIFLMASVLVTSLVMKSKGYFLVTVEGSSMENTINDSDKLVAKKSSKVSFGDIIIISGEDTYEIIKRAIAFAGDTVEIKNGGVYVNGTLLQEPYAKGETNPMGIKWTWQVKEGEIFYLGDNRDVSKDSRWFDVCDINQVEGVVCDWSLTLRPFNNFIFGLFS